MFPLLLFLFLLLFRGCLWFRLLVLRRRRRLRRCRSRRRRALLLALGRHGRLRPQSGLAPARLGLTGCRTSGFGTVIRSWLFRLCRRRAIRLRSISRL